MQMRQLPTLAMAVAVVGAAALGIPGAASADILVTLTDGTGGSAISRTYDLGSSNTVGVLNHSIGSYTVNVDTVITSYPGGPAGGQISTTVNIETLGSGGKLENLSVTVQLENPSNNHNLMWSSGSSDPITAVTASSTLVNQSHLVSGTVAVGTYYNSPGLMTGLGSSTVTASNGVNGANSNVVYLPGTAPYTLSQTITLSGVNVSGQSIFSTSATSSAVAAPEPSSLAIASLGALGLIGYGLRRRRPRAPEATSSTTRFD
jgi:hypothetical protein